MPLYWILGQEVFQRQEHLQAIKSKLMTQYPHCQRQQRVLHTAQDWHHLREIAREWGDLFSDHHLVECQIPQTIAKEGLHFLQEWVEKMAAHSSLIMLVDKPDCVRATPYQSLLKSGTVYWAKNILPKDFILWLKNHTKKKGLKLAHDAFLSLVRYTEGNLLAANQIVEKLRLFKQGIITETEILPLLMHQSQGNIFDLIEASIAGKTEKTFRILTTLYSEGVEPHLVLWAITREVRIVIHIATAVRSGTAVQEACASAGVRPSRIHLYNQALSLVPLHQFYLLLSEAQGIDRIIKGLDLHNAYEAIGRWLLTLDKWLNKDRGFVA